MGTCQMAQWKDNLKKNHTSSQLPKANILKPTTATLGMEAQ